MNGKKNPYCAVRGCSSKNANLEKHHFFKFPKEHNRWLQWVQACGRLDLEAKGPEYAAQNCRLCHLHFEGKWYKVNKIRARLHPDAVPTIFSEPTFEENNITIVPNAVDNADATQMDEEIHMEHIENNFEKDGQDQHGKDEDGKNKDGKLFISTCAKCYF